MFGSASVEAPSVEPFDVSPFDVSHPDRLSKPRSVIAPDEIAEVLDPPRRRRRRAVIHVHVLARAQSVQMVVQASRPCRVEEHHALLIGGLGDHAVAKHAPGAVQRDVQVRRHGGARAAATGGRVRRQVGTRAITACVVAPGARRSIAGEASMRNTTDSRSICFGGSVGRDDDMVRDVGGEHHGERSWLLERSPRSISVFWAPLSFRDPRAFPKAREERTSTCASSSSSSSSS